MHFRDAETLLTFQDVHVRRFLLITVDVGNDQRRF